MKRIQEYSLWLFLCFGALGLGATVYQMMVIVPAFAHNLPDSLLAFNQSAVKTAVFWTSPWMRLGALTGLIALIVHWRTARRAWLMAALALIILAFGFTFIYFYPRLAMMGFTLQGQPAVTDGKLLARAASEWVSADQWRFWTMIVPAYLCSLKALSIPLARES
ncbi:MAG: hypothetical protein U0Z53_02605 [Blastocatellia bacterium]